jgi:hypothetical protein
MLVTVCSAKGSPGVTSLALTIAALWPEQTAILLEVDPTGGDLGFRCRHVSGREVATSPNLLGLATAVRGSPLDGLVDPGLLREHSQPLACGPRLVPGVPAPAQARGLGSLWSQIAQAATGSSHDVIADLGRLERTGSASHFAAAADVIVLVCAPTLESVMHVRHLVLDVVPTLPARRGGRRFVPVVVRPYRQAAGDAADIDQILGGLGMPIERTVPVAYEPRALAELEAGANPAGRLARTHLLQTAKALVQTLVDLRDQPTGRNTPWEARRR